MDNDSYPTLQYILTKKLQNSEFEKGNVFNIYCHHKTDLSFVGVIFPATMHLYNQSFFSHDAAYYFFRQGGILTLEKSIYFTVAKGMYRNLYRCCKME